MVEGGGVRVFKERWSYTNLTHFKTYLNDDWKTANTRANQTNPARQKEKKKSMCLHLTEYELGCYKYLTHFITYLNADHENNTDTRGEKNVGRSFYTPWCWNKIDKKDENVGILYSGCNSFFFCISFFFSTVCTRNSDEINALKKKKRSCAGIFRSALRAYTNSAHTVTY